MSDTYVEALINELKAWCKEKHGRNTQVAKMFDVSQQLVSDWFSGRAVPTLATGLKIQEFLKQQRRRRRRTK
jgi:transcriptional regulator with XRE-family HTH domain